MWVAGGGRRILVASAAVTRGCFARRGRGPGGGGAEDSAGSLWP